MALFFECAEKCALNKLDEADIVRDGVMATQRSVEAANAGSSPAGSILPSVESEFAEGKTEIIPSE